MFCKSGPWVIGHPRSLKLLPFKSLGAVFYSPSMAVSVAVCETFIVKKCCDLEKRVRVHSRLLEMAPFNRSHTSSYLPPIVTTARLLSSTRLIGRKSRNFYSPAVFSAPAGGDAVGISWRCLLLVKLEWLGYRMVKNLWQYVKPFSSDTGTWRTDRQIDGRTDGQNCYISIARQCADVR